MNFKLYTENDTRRKKKVGSTKYIEQICKFYKEECDVDVEVLVQSSPTINKLDKVRGLFNLFLFNIPLQIFYRKKKNYDINSENELAFVESIYLAPFVNNKEKTILLAQDSLSRLQFSIASQQKNCFKRIYYLISGFSYLTLEMNVYKNFRKVLFVSKKDLQYIDAQIQTDNLDVLEIGLDQEELYEYNSKDLERKISNKYGEYIIFTGNMNYPPNHDAVLQLVNYIFPEVKKTQKNLKLLLVGVGSEKYNNLDENIYGLGKVESLKEYISQSLAYVSPLYSGSGMKNKVLEALAQKSLVLATPKSVEGIDGLIDELNYIQCSNNNDFINKISDVMNYKFNDSNIKKNGYSYILENHLFINKNAKKLKELIIK